MCNYNLCDIPDEDEELEKVGDAAYIVKLDDDDSDSEDGDIKQIWNDLYCDNHIEEVDGDSDVSSETSDESDRSMSPVLDDTNCRLTLFKKCLSELKIPILVFFTI